MAGPFLFGASDDKTPVEIDRSTLPLTIPRDLFNGLCNDEGGVYAVFLYLFTQHCAFDGIDNRQTQRDASLLLGEQYPAAWEMLNKFMQR